MRRQDLHSAHRNIVPNVENRLPQEFLPYAETLRGAGYERLIPMLDKEVEYTVLNGLEKCLVKALDKSHPSPFARERLPDEAKNIRLQVEESMRDLVKKQSLNTGILPVIKIIPPENLFGISAPVGPVISQLTDFGKAIKSLKDKWEDLSIFLYHGRARDSAGTKPTYRIKDKFKEKTFRIPSLQKLTVQNPTGEKIPSDFDLLGVASTRSRNNFFPPNLEYIVRKFRQEIFSIKNSGWANVVESTRRTGFTRVDFGTLGSEIRNKIGKTIQIRRKSFGHLFGPAFKEKYDLQNLLLPFLMESARIDIPVLLVPYLHKFDELHFEWMFWGIAIDFFGGFEDIEGKKLGKQSWMGREFIEAQYPFPENTFPRNSVQQLVFNLGYALRTWAWDDKQPVIRLPSISPPPEDQLEDPDVIRRRLMQESKDTQQYLTEHVIYPLSRTLSEKNARLGSESQRLEFGISLLEDITVGLNGDPIATLLRLLPAGVSFTKNDTSFFNTNTNIYGLGIFDENGLFPEIGKLLADKTILNSLKKQIFNFEENQYRVEDGWGDKNIISPKGLFFDFLFEQAGGNSSRALELLRPVWCNAEEWKTMRDKNFTRLTALDERFGIKVDRETASKQVLKAMMTIQSPITATEISAQSGTPIGTVFRVLSDLADRGELVRLGGKKTRNGIEQGGLGTGGFKSWFCTPEVNVKLVESGGIFPYLSPQEKVVYVLDKTSGYTVKELMETTLLSVSIIYAVLKILEEEGKAERTGFINKNDLWAIKKDLKS